jgi:CubicO group peptidase (beta-lactamase class C family)
MLRFSARTRSAVLLAATLAVTASTSLVAQPSVTDAHPGTASSASSALLPDRMARLDAWLDGLVSEREIPGAVVLIMHNGSVAYEKAYGVRDLGTGAPMRTDDIFRIASQSKAITSLAVMMLWEEGRFQLDDPIARYIPAFAKQTVLTKFNPADSSYESTPARRRTTIRQLLTHTSGLDYADIGSDDFKAIYGKAGLTAFGRSGSTLEADINALATLPLRHEPGERFTYGLSTDVLGRLVEVLSGLPFDQFLRQRILDPLQMKDTWFELPADRRDRLVALHQPDSKRVLQAVHEAQGIFHPDYPAKPVTYFSGGAGLSSTTRDYARFLQLFLNGGELDGVRLLSRKTVELMLTNQVGDLQPAFGLGFALETPANDFRSPVSLGTFSWGGAFNTTYWADPKEQLVALIFTNTYGARAALGDPFEVFVYGAMR